MLRLIKHGASAENAAADFLRCLIVRSWPDVESDPHCDIRIITGVYLSGQKVDDLDIVLLAVFERPREVSLVDATGSIMGSYLLGSLCAVIEVKSHQHESAEIRAGAVWVTYDGEKKSVTKQSVNQMLSLGRFLVTTGAGRPHITRFIWLENIKAAQLRASSTNSELPHEVILGDSTWEDVLFSIWRGWRGRHPEARGFSGNKYFISADIDRYTPADFNLISKSLTNEEMLLSPFSYANLPEEKMLRPPILFDRLFANGRGLRSTFTVRNFLLAFALMIGVGVVAAVFTPRLLLWPQQQQSPAKGDGKLAAYIGRYRCQSVSETLEITMGDRDDRLQMNSMRGVIDLSSTGPDKFKTMSTKSDFQGVVRFSRTTGAKIANLSMLPAGGRKVICFRIQ